MDPNNDFKVFLHRPKGPDNGYTKVCAGCDKRHGEKPELVGKTRYLDLELCADCMKWGLSVRRY